MIEFSLVQKMVVYSLPVLFAITMHELAHGLVADKLGDPTPRAMGRLSLDPLAHIDLIGTVILPLVLLVLGGGIFGWAKPIPINERNLSRNRDICVVILAGPIANIVMALIWAGLTKLGFWLGHNSTASHSALLLTAMGYAGININITFAVLNLLPIPPLDGSKLAATLLPPRWIWHLRQWPSPGIVILLILCISGVLSYIISPIIATLVSSILMIFALPL